MKNSRSILIIAAAFVCGTISAQNPQDAINAAAGAIAAAPDAPAVKEKPHYWTSSLKSNINYNQTALTNWAAGGDNTFTLSGYVDGNANYKKGDIYLNNRLQLNYGFIYAESKPILQKNNDQIKFESSFGQKVNDKLSLSANYTFISQFNDGFNYKTPGADLIAKYGGPSATKLDDLTKKAQELAWKDARVIKSGFLSPANTTLGIGISYVPAKWLSINFTPLTGGYVIVTNQALRKSYGMELSDKYKDMDPESDEYKNAVADGSAYKGARFEFGAQLKMDAKININNNTSASSQLILFSNYLKNPQNMRVLWDNRIDWKLTKLFTLTFITNLIYDDTIMIADEFGISKQRIQFKESLGFGFTYTITNKK